MLKLLGILAMLADHLNILVFDSQYDSLYWLGRLALPIFCFLIARNYFLTSNCEKYLGRLLFFGILSQPIYWLVFDYPLYYLNVFFSLALGLFLIDRLHNVSLFAIPFILFASLFMDGGIIAVPLIFLFYLLLRSFPLPDFDARLRLNRYAFYAFYPTHLLALWCVKWLMLRAPAL